MTKEDAMAWAEIKATLAVPSGPNEYISTMRKVHALNDLAIAFAEVLKAANVIADLGR